LNKTHYEKRIAVKMNQSYALRITGLILLILSLTGLSTGLRADTGSCAGRTVTLPFTDVMGNNFFCQIASAYFSGLTSGTSATTYSPGQPVTREQMAAFITRTLDQSLRRGSRKAAAKKWFNPLDANSLTTTIVGQLPARVEFDGEDLWVSNVGTSSVTRVRPGDGRVLETWTEATSPGGIVAAMGRIFIGSATNPGRLYMIDPRQPAGVVTTVSSSLGGPSSALAFDGSRIWSANNGSISIISFNPTTVTNITTGFLRLRGILFDGANIWVTDEDANTLMKLNANGSIAQTLTVGSAPIHPVFDGMNIWVPNQTSSSITVVRVKDSQGNPLESAFVLATLTGNGLNTPFFSAFDGERIAVTNQLGNQLSLWKATDLTPLGAFPMGEGTIPLGVCSDGLNFWVTITNMDRLARF
jgi:DNA-binding beta-propeller fold protein YncE